MNVFEISRLVHAPKEIVWEVISDVEGYADIAPNLAKATILSGEGQGMVRQCWDTRGGTWRENCILWQEGRAYSMQVDTSDYPYPLLSMQGTWSLAEQADGVLITMRFEYQMKYGMVGWVMHEALFRRQFPKICEELLDNWQAQIKTQAVSAAAL